MLPPSLLSGSSLTLAFPGGCCILTALMPDSCWLSCSTIAMTRGCRWMWLPRSWSRDSGRSRSSFRFSSFSPASASDTSARPVRRFKPGGEEGQV